ncbi:U-box domain-containing protein 4 [Nymphaea thermarum]|nr:U-box domain-containing protein 4 [Nymphaea thermarum]
MEHSVRRDPVNCMSQFNNLLPSRKVKAGQAQICYERIGVILTLIKPVVEEIIHSELALNEKLQRRLEELCICVDDSMKLMENWQPMSSKFYNRHEFTSQNQVLSMLKEAIEDQRQGTSPSSETLARIAKFLSLSSNHDLLVEAVILEKAKLKAGHENNTAEVELIDQVIGLVNHMHGCLLKIKQSQTLDGMLIPDDFRCPLSLEPMRDPVIVASGQTYERVVIRKWLDLGLTVCPKTRQSLVHTNLTPNIAVKQLIGNWCELKKVKFPDPSNDVNLNQLSKLLEDVEHVPTNACLPTIPSPKSSESVTLASPADHNFPNESTLASCRSETFSSGSGPQRVSDSSSASGPSVSLLDVRDESEDEAKSFPIRNEDVRPDSDGMNETFGHPNVIINEEDHLQSGSIGEGRNCSTTVSGAIFIHRVQSESGNPIEMSNGTANDNRNISSGVTSESPASGQVLDIKTGSRSLWRQPFQWNLVSNITSSPAVASTSNQSDIEAEVQKLVQDLQSSSQEIQRSAAVGLRFLARHSMENRIIIAHSGAIMLLVNLLYSTDMETQENAVTALLNLSINDNNKTIIVDAGAIEPLIHVLKVGNVEAKENSAAALFSLSVTGESKIKIGRSGAIQPLVDLLGNGTPRGKRDAATALYNLSACPENKLRIVQAGAVKHLIELMDPAFGMIDKAVAVLSNLSTIAEGCNVIGQQGGIPVLVEVVELGSSRAKERAASALLQLCNNSRKFSNMVLQEGAVPPLVALTQFGTARAKEKVSLSLSLTLTHPLSLSVSLSLPSSLCLACDVCNLKLKGRRAYEDVVD